MGKRIVTAVVLIPAVLYLVLLGRPLWIVLAVAVVGLLALHEYLNLVKALGADPMTTLTLICAVGVFAATAFSPTLFLLPALSVSAFLLLAFAMFTRPLHGVLADSAFCFFGLVYVAYPLATIPLIASQENGHALLLLLLLVVWAGDILALFTGKLIGRHKLAPKISPGKTWEGFAGSVAGSLIVATLLFYLAERLNLSSLGVSPYPGRLIAWLGLALLINLAAQLGDLLESAMKRGAGVKDSGTLLPGHGGVLDRIDALLLAAPVLWYAQLVQQYFW